MYLSFAFFNIFAFLHFLNRVLVTYGFAVRPYTPWSLIL